MLRLQKFFCRLFFRSLWDFPRSKGNAWCGCTTIRKNRKGVRNEWHPCCGHLVSPRWSMSVPLPALGVQKRKTVPCTCVHDTATVTVSETCPSRAGRQMHCRDAGFRLQTETIGEFASSTVSRRSCSASPPILHRFLPVDCPRENWSCASFIERLTQPADCQGLEAIRFLPTSKP
jgi:hypothetical protein